MALGVLSWINHIDDALISASDEAASLPATNLADPVVMRPWRVVGSTEGWAQAVWPDAVEISVIGLFGLEMVATDTVRIRASAGDDPTAGDLLDTGAVACGAVDGYRAHALLLDAPISALSLRIDISAPGRASAGFFDVGRWWAGPIFEPADRRNFAYGWGAGWQDHGDTMRSRAGAIYARDLWMARAMSVSYEALTPDDADRLLEMQRLVGVTGQLLFWPDPASDRLRHKPMLACVSGDLDPITEPNFELTATGMTLLETL